MSDDPRRYNPNWISRRFETPVAWWFRNTWGLPLWLAPFAIFVALVWIWLLAETVDEVWTLTSGTPEPGPGRDVADANRNRVQAISFGAAIIGALLTAIGPGRISVKNYRRS